MTHAANSADGAQLGAARVTGLDGRDVTLASLWEARPVVLVFLRHFG